MRSIFALSIGVALLVTSGSTIVACGSAKEPSVGSNQQAWNASSATDETKSTHLWVVNRAIDILSAHVNDMAGVANTLAWIRDDNECRLNWENGLFEADFLAPYNAGTSDLTTTNTEGCCCGVDLSAIAADVDVVAANSTWLIHFFDPTTSLDYGGFSISSDIPNGAVLHPIYRSIRAVLESGGTTVPVEARGAALYRLGRATDLLEGVAVPADHNAEPSDVRGRGCYELGLSMHYVTDITQPMHASNFTAKSKPRLLHPNFEAYAQSIQGNYVVSDWNQTPSGGALVDVIQQIAATSRAHWVATDGSPGPLKAAFQSAYGAGSTWDGSGNPTWTVECKAEELEARGSIDKISLDVAKCWQNNPAVTRETGSALADAQQSTAQYLAALQLPTYVASGAAPAPGDEADAGAEDSSAQASPDDASCQSVDDGADGCN